MTENELLEQYASKDEGNEVFMPPIPLFTAILDTSKVIEENIYKERNVANFEQVKNDLNKTYLTTFIQSLQSFAKAVNNGKFKLDEYPIAEWKYLAGEDSRFIMHNFPKLFAMVNENAQVNNYDVFIYAAQSLSPKDFSSIVGNFNDDEKFAKFTSDLHKLFPEKVRSPDFNPLEDAISLGNYELVKKMKTSSKINELLMQGILKKIDKISIDTNLILRLASFEDMEVKKNIVKSICEAENNGFIRVSKAEIESKNKAHYGTLSHIETDKKLSYADIYMFSNNGVSLFTNNNERLIKLKKIQDEKLYGSQPKLSSLNNF